MGKVTSENFAELLLRSARQAAEIEEGTATPARTSRRKRTSREVAVRQPPRFPAERIVKLRKRLGVSQTIFAGMMGVQPPTVRAWEQEQKEPAGAARRLLEIFEERPALAESTIERNGAT